MRIKQITKNKQLIPPLVYPGACVCHALILIFCWGGGGYDIDYGLLSLPFHKSSLSLPSSCVTLYNVLVKSTKINKSAF